MNMMLGRLDTHMQKNESRAHSLPYTKVNSTLIKEQKWNLLEENKEEAKGDIVRGPQQMTQVAREIIPRAYKWHHKKKCLHYKGDSHRIKRELRIGKILGQLYVRQGINIQNT